MPSILETFVAGVEAETIALAGIRLFFLLLVLLISRNIPHLFLRWDGISHRAAGALHLFWLILGVFAVISPPSQINEELLSAWMNRCIIYDTILGCLGVTATLTAARDFPHRHIKNAPGQSGTLSRIAVVTQKEMIEHSFYQALNLIQSLYLHGMGWWWYVEGDTLPSISFEVTGRKMLSLLLVTSPWLARRLFPVNSFSANWTMAREQTLKKQSSSSPSSGTQRWVSTATKNRDDRQQQQLEILLYQIKKWQYVFYKHVILHGLNISVAFPSPTSPPPQIPFTLTRSWRIFWLALNTSYVMEFFMQTLVKRKVLAQNTMLMLQRLLMAASSIAAITAIFNVVRPGVAALSLVLNFSHRHHDIFNTMLVGALASYFPWF